MTRQLSKLLLLATLAIALAGCVSDTPSVYDAPYSEAELPAEPTCYDPPIEPIRAASDYIRETPQNFGDQKPTGPWKALDDGSGGILLATRLPDGQIAMFHLEGGPVYGVTEVNTRFPGAATVASCL